MPARAPLALLVLLLGLGSLGQRPGEPPRDLNMLALGWTRGDWRAPLVCTIEGVAHRGLRRVLIAPGPRHVRPLTARVQLFDLEIPGGTRCTDENARPQPNALGSLYYHLEGISRPDNAERDFQDVLRREGAFEFRVKRGRLRVGGEDGEPPREVDFAGGTARFAVVKRGTDAYRRLAGFGDRRRLTLALEAPAGDRLDLDLVQFGLR